MSLNCQFVDTHPSQITGGQHGTPTTRGHTIDGTELSHLSRFAHPDDDHEGKSARNFPNTQFSSAIFNEMLVF